MKHTFHTRHDFTPDLGWAAFQLIGEFPDEGATVEQLALAASVLASPLARRADLGKLFATIEELRLIERIGERLRLAPVGQALRMSEGRYEAGFIAGVHCLYAWNWVLDGLPSQATPSWSYREVCRAIREAGPAGIEHDAVVLKVVAAASRFDADRVSFSRSSVNGVAGWLKAHTPPLVEQVGGRLYPATHRRPGLTSVRLHMAALCASRGGAADIGDEEAALLADVLLIPPGELRAVIHDSLIGSKEFHLLKDTKRVVFRTSDDPFLHWIGHEKNRPT
jgi:hypothetical protein